MQPIHEYYRINTPPYSACRNREKKQTRSPATVCTPQGNTSDQKRQQPPVIAQTPSFSNYKVKQSPKTEEKWWPASMCVVFKFYSRFNANEVAPWLSSITLAQAIPKPSNISLHTCLIIKFLLYIISQRNVFFLSSRERHAFLHIGKPARSTTSATTHSHTQPAHNVVLTIIRAT